MYKWHVHSAIGRGRPIAGDFAKVADGIAASLRQFSLSASKSAENGSLTSAIFTDLATYGNWNVNESLQMDLEYPDLKDQLRLSRKSRPLPLHHLGASMPVH